jgi:hypothetical protein
MPICSACSKKAVVCPAVKTIWLVDLGLINCFGVRYCIG